MIPPVLPVYKRLDVGFTHGKGACLFTADGRRYLDFICGIAVHAFGHAHPRLVRTLQAQAEKVWHVSNFVRIPEQERVAEKLARLTCGDTVFFTNSGVEAWECGVKMIRRYFWAKGEAHRNRLVVATGAFHGRTVAAISAARTPKMTDGFAPLADGFDAVPFGDVAAMEKAITRETAAVCLEPVQGESGVVVPPAGYLQAVRALCDAQGILLFLDEVQTGMGRTGTLWAYQQAGVTPDVMSVAKALGAGFPVGACIATEAVASAMTVGSHGSTYSGNPLAMAVVGEVLEMITQEGFLESVQRKGALLGRGLEELVVRFPDQLAEARGLGLLRGVALQAESYSGMQQALFERGLLTVGAGKNVIRFLPPLNVSEAEIEEALGLLAEACTARAGSS